jgi:hypothetical protein
MPFWDNVGEKKTPSALLRFHDNSGYANAPVFCYTYIAYLVAIFVVVKFV